MTKNWDNWDDLCDEEKSFVTWIRKNHQLINLDHSIIDMIQTAYMQGYAAGFQTKLKYSSEQYLQK